MRFIHMADVHFDSPFTVLASRENLANERRLEQRKACLLYTSPSPRDI